MGVCESTLREPLDHFLKHGSCLPGAKKKKKKSNTLYGWILWGARNDVAFKGQIVDVETIFNRRCFFRGNSLRKGQVETFVFLLNDGVPLR